MWKLSMRINRKQDKIHGMRNYIFRFWELEDFENQFNAFIEKNTTAEIISVRVSSPFMNNSTVKREMATAFIVYF